MSEHIYHVFRGTQYLGQKSRNELMPNTPMSFEDKGTPGDIAIPVYNHTVSFELNPQSYWMHRNPSTLPKEIQAWLLIVTT